MTKFAERLKEIRTERNVSSTTLADAIGVAHSAISMWENKLRVPSADNVYKIAQYFGVSSDYLLGLTDY